MSSDKQTTAPNPIFILQNSKPITCLLFSTKNSNILYSGNRNGDLTIYDISLRRSTYSTNPNKESILSIIELDEANLLAYCRNGSIFKWIKSESEWHFNCVYQKENYTFCQFEISIDKKYIYLPSSRASIIDCIELDSFTQVNNFKASTSSAQEQRGMLMSLKVLNSNHLIAAYENGELVLFDLKTSTELSCLNLFNGQPLMCFDFSDNLKVGYAGSAESEILGFIINQNERLEQINSITLVNPGVNCIKIRTKDSKIFASGGWDSKVRVYGTKKQKFLACLDFHKEAINSIDFSSDNLMAVGSNDGLISFWNLY